MDLSPLETALARGRDGRVVVLTGAGISAESGIPTFRGPEGYWTVGSREYRPEELATFRAFGAMPQEVWAWYLYRLGVCRGASPNAAHHALRRLEEGLGERLTLITQNVDGLHLRAGQTSQRMCEIHGNIEWLRCDRETPPRLWRQPPDLEPRNKTTPLSDRDRTRLWCSRCDDWSRPHVLWFDETYEEELYRAETALRAAATADLFIVVGTSGGTTLPLHAASLAAARGAAFIDVNPEPNPFAETALQCKAGHALRGSAVEILPDLVDDLLGG